jgi:signal transduction histidine kinase
LRLIEAAACDPDAVRRYVAGARDAVERGVALTHQLLTFARHQELDAHAGDVNEFLHQFEPFLRYGAGPQIRLVLQLSPGLPRCVLDPTLFDSAVLNLIVNARDAMPKGGEVRIRTDELVIPPGRSSALPAGTYVRVRVEDQGTGMSPEVLGRIFNPFFSTKGESGTGLGLAQVQAFMHLVGGCVEVESQPGAGTACDLIFPAL